MPKYSRLAGKVAALGLAITAPLIAGAGIAQAAAAAPDLDVTKCQVVRDYANYGDGINWYHFNIVYTNEGNAASGPFRSAAQPVWSTHGVFENGNEVREEFQSPSLAPGQSVSAHYWVTERVVQNKLWGVFLDIKNQVPDAQKSDNFCSAWVDQT